MKLDPTYLQYITKEELRVLTAVEMGMRNHEYVPMNLIERISHLKKANAYKVLQLCLKNKLVVHVSVKYDGYKLTYLGYDYLALYTFIKRGMLKTVCGKMGVGKESDIYRCINHDNEVVVLKLARLGRTSFRTIKKNRDYLQNKTNYNWLYLSRLSSLKEFSFMQILYSNGFPTPKPIDSNRHGILMSYIDGFPLCQVREMEGVADAYKQSIDLLVKFYEHGLIHSDFNEFNLMIDEENKIRIIDFPQTVSIAHKNADFYIERDYNCVQLFFKKRFDYDPNEPTIDFTKIKVVKRLDMEVKASGFLHQELEDVSALNILDDYENFVDKNVDPKKIEESDEDEELEGENKDKEMPEDKKEDTKEEEKNIENNEDEEESEEIESSGEESGENEENQENKEEEKTKKKKEKPKKEEKDEKDEKEFIKNAVKKKFKRKFKTNHNHVKAKEKIKAVDYFF